MRAEIMGFVAVDRMIVERRTIPLEVGEDFHPTSIRDGIEAMRRIF